MSVEFSNSTFSMPGTVLLDPLSHIVFTDWNYTYDQTHKFFQTLKNSADLRSFEIIDGENEFKWTVERWGLVQYFEQRFDKITGMLLYSNLEAEEEGVSINLEFHQKGYEVPLLQTTSFDMDTNTGGFTIPGDPSEISPPSTKTLGAGNDTSGTDSTETGDTIGLAGFRSVTSLIALFATITVLRRRK